ncbi:PIN/TRAM domain-containing protein [Oceanirhabdus seepicola]|uniref:PIN/TRAM domain-containing protein n=1 Tax=Oceanirhabdus seepicola TaxID=2828781 RepID=A0A9J6NZU8_9CLOT|nr:PIN/TRAM domain-containing protein [Oceanirhabdus seepicola]MCM1989620.1 PIN/TRAM domain-containing protein [Oceanirhabdus seepicola]
MLKKILRSIIVVSGLILGYMIGMNLIKYESFSFINNFKDNLIYEFAFMTFFSLIIGIIFFIVSPIITSAIIRFIEYIEKSFQKIPISDVLFGTTGAIIGLLITTLFFSVIKIEHILWTSFMVIANIVMAVLGADILRRKRDEIMSFLESIKKNSASFSKEKKLKVHGAPKVLDTSVIIDGRILDICQTGFIEGSLIIPHFVLEELRHIADSADDLKRNRGRRGLDILNKIQKELDVPVELTDKDFPDIAEVDSKLLKLAQVLKGVVLTNDFNLNKVAKLQGVKVLNINELANAVKPVVLPGEEMQIQIIKDGKEPGQGIAYLDDGTMIVVDGGKKQVGHILKVVVTSVLQTAAGRMIFARKKETIEGKGE